MKAAGLRGDDAVLCYRTYADFILTYAATRAQYLLLDDDIRFADDEAWREVYGALPRSDFPNVGELATELADVDNDVVIITGLQMVRGGMRITFMNEYLEQPRAVVSVPAVVPDMSDSAEQLVAAAAAGQGIDLTGEMGLPSIWISLGPK